MKWTVVSLPTADADLALIYSEATDKAEITHASHEIDRLLQHDPDKKGEDFYGDRIVQYGPLAVVYQLSPEDMLVRVIQFLRVKG